MTGGGESMGSVKIVSWNVQFGGGAKRTSGILEQLVRRSPDLIVLGEYQTKNSSRLLAGLRDSGWSEQATPQPPEGYGGVAIVSKRPLEVIPPPPALSALEYRFLSVGVPSLGLSVKGVYGPLEGGPIREYWEGVLADLETLRAGRVLVAGDFNTGADGMDSTARTVPASQHFSRLESHGYTDLWRAKHGVDAKEHTWAGPVHGYRLDHAFGSSTLAASLVACYYDHDVREMELSDHSLMTIELAG